MAGGPEMSPGRADRRVVMQRLSVLRQAVAVLRRRAGVSADELEADTELRWAVERGLLFCAQIVLDVACHLESAAGRAPQSYRAAIDGLAASGALPPGLAARFRDAAGFRNAPVHGYFDIDLELVARFLAERLEDFEEFARCVELWIEESPGSRNSAPHHSGRANAARWTAAL